MYNSHQATNLAIDHSGNFLDIDINYYWLKVSDVVQFKPQHFQQYDGIWVAPGPFQNIFFLNIIIRAIAKLNIPVLLTGESFRSFVEVLIQSNDLNPNSEKLISDNLVEGNHFERIQIVPHSKEFLQLYENHSTIELTSSRYSLYPQLVKVLLNDFIDIEAYDQFEDPEVISLKAHDFFVACSFCPQVSSTREIPHPLIYTFLKAMLACSDTLS